MSIAQRDQIIKDWLRPMAYDELAGFQITNIVGTLDVLVTCLGHSALIGYLEIIDQREDTVRPKLQALASVAYHREKPETSLYKRLVVWFVRVRESRHFYPHEAHEFKELMDAVQALEEQCK